MTALTFDIAPTHHLPSWFIPTSVLVGAYIGLPLIGGSYIFEALLTPFLILSLAAVGLNLLTGYAGQVSLGSAAFMAVGAYAAYNLQLRIPGVPLLASIGIAGIAAAI